MAGDKTTILVVDDDLHILEFLDVYIRSIGYEVVKAANGSQALEQLREAGGGIDAIVSDVDMPEMNGYSLCENVRADEQLREIPLIFASALTTLEEKLKGYDVGGDDYITKPLEGEEVATKVKHIIDERIRHQTLTKDLEASRNAAMQAMSYTSNLGQVLQFMKGTMEVNDFAGLSNKLFAVTEALGIATVIQFHTSTVVMNYKQDGEVTPLEANVIELARGKQRIFDFDARTIFNYSDFSLLILNMPVSDQEKYGLMKDILANLCDAIEVKVKVLLSSVQVQHKDEVIQTVNQSLGRVGQLYRDIQQANILVIDDMLNGMEEAMFGFGLTENQEDTVRGIVAYGKSKTTEIFEDGAELFEEFDKIHRILAGELK